MAVSLSPSQSLSLSLSLPVCLCSDLKLAALDALALLDFSPHWKANEGGEQMWTGD